jgi:hypothetical protein
MIDALCLLALFSFFALLLYSTAMKPERKEAQAEPPSAPSRGNTPCSPGPIGLFCQVCRESAGIVSAEEYSRISASGEPVYCPACMLAVESYKARMGRY